MCALITENLSYNIFEECAYIIIVGVGQLNHLNEYILKIMK